LHDEGGHVDAGQILAEVLMPCRYASETGRGRGAAPDVSVELNGLFADTFAQQEVRVVEVLEKLREERITFGDDGFLDSLEDTAVHVLRVVVSFSGNGGTAEINTAFLTPLVPYFPK